MTVSEVNTLFPTISGLFVINRLLWLVLGLAVFALGAALYRFDPDESPRAPGKSAAVPKTAIPEATDPVVSLNALPVARPERGQRWKQIAHLVRFDTGFVLTESSFGSSLLLLPFLVGFVVWTVNEQYGCPSLPATRLMVGSLNRIFAFYPVLMALLIGFDLVWRARDRRFHEIVDATPVPEWVPFLSRVGTITAIAAANGLALIIGPVVVQLVRGTWHLEPLTYLLGYLEPLVLKVLHLTVLSMFGMVLVARKNSGVTVAIVLMGILSALPSLGIDHPLLRYGYAPDVPLSDMNGRGHFWIAQAGFQLAWTLMAMLLLVGTYVLSQRGVESTLRQRLRTGLDRLRGGPGWLALGSGLAFVGVGGFLYWNTNILNRYVPAAELDRRMAEAEKVLSPYEDLPQPRIADVKLKVDLYPREARAVTEGVYRLVNRTGKSISELHLDMDPRLELERLEFPGARLKTGYPDRGYRIYALTSPLQPGQQQDLRFRTVLRERGIISTAPLTSIVENGTFLYNGQITPYIGKSREDVLTDRAKRRRYGLPEIRHLPAPGAVEGRDRSILRHDSDWVTADLTVTTDADQTPVAPGRVISDRTVNGRRTVHVRPDGPVQHFFSIQSARYAIARDRLGDIDLAVYHHPDHATNVKRMLRAMKLSLRLYSGTFSPYPFHQARILEFPAYTTFAQSFANTIPYSEDMGFLANVSDPEAIDVVTYVTAHEMAHQWWGHQVVAAEQQGARFIIESLSQYSALLVMETFYGPEHMRRFLKYELDAYLKSRIAEGMEEVPLVRVENQPYIHYKKGSLALWWLREVIGAPAVNRALASFAREYAFRPAPYPSSLDLLRHLRREAGPEHGALITDLFERITLVDVRAEDPVVTKRPDGRWDVRFRVKARKFQADGQGAETEVPLDEWFDVGVFASEIGKAGYTASDILFMKRLSIHTGTQSVQVTVDREPAYVGVDPYNRRIDRNPDDNVVAVPRT
ncbi:MAG: M1 family aminopeptidase [bacterium]|nr:M1 family aminopeptidase [bacterium]